MQLVRLLGCRSRRQQADQPNCGQAVRGLVLTQATHALRAWTRSEMDRGLLNCEQALFASRSGDRPGRLHEPISRAPPWARTHPWSRRDTPFIAQRSRIAVPGPNLEKRANEGGSRRGHHPKTGTTMIDRLRPAAAASHTTTASARLSGGPSSEAVEDDACSEVPRRTPPRDQSQRRRAEKTTVRPPAAPHGVANDKATLER